MISVAKRDADIPGCGKVAVAAPVLGVERCSASPARSAK